MTLLTNDHTSAPAEDHDAGAPEAHPTPIATDMANPPVAPEALLAAPGRRLRGAAVPRSLSRAAMVKVLGALEGGSLVLIEPDGRRRFHARRSDRYGRPDQHATLEVRDPRFYGALLRGSSGLGEAYQHGWFDTDDLTSLLRLLARLTRRADPARQRIQRVTSSVADPIRRHRKPDAERDRRHIAAHYDLGNSFFELFLDETLTYSSGLFPNADAPLEDASSAKIDRICRQLDLRPGARVAEIGTGWGSFAIHAARHYGAHVTTTTLSAEQHRAARARVLEAGLGDLVDVRLDHYRDLQGTFDAVVAIEMIEAVDWREVDDLMSHCARLIGPTGAVALQAIVAAPARYGVARDANDFIKTHIFPGSSIPSVESILASAARTTDLIPTDLSDFGMHYAHTLRRWRTALADRRDDAVQLGLDEPFLRLWDFYLSYCEAAFEERWVSVVQVLLERPGRSPSLAG